MNRPQRLSLLGLCLLLPLMGGCNYLAYAAAVIPGPPQAAAYPGLAGQRVAIMTWADPAAVFNYQSFGSDVRLDMSMAVQNKLLAAIAADPKLEELQGTTYIDSRQIYRWGRNHPEMENRAITEVAPRLAAEMGATRVIYLELQPFMTRDPKTEILLKGYTVANVRVVEVNGTAAKVAFEDAGVVGTFPDKAPEGVPPSESVDETYVYRGLIDRVSTEVALRFFSYQYQ